jgi:MFS family permease
MGRTMGNGSRGTGNRPASSSDPFKVPAIQILANGGVMGGLTFIQILARDIGVDNTGIGMLVFFYALALFVSNTAFGRSSDLRGRRQFIWGGLAAASAAFMVLAFTDGFWSLLVARTLTGFTIGIFLPALVAYNIEAKKRLSRFASYGSIGWGVGVLILGFVAQLLGIRWVFILSSGFFASAFLFALSLDPVRFRSISVPRIPSAIIRRNSALYASVLVRHSGAVMIWTFWPLFMVETLGLDLIQVGIIQATNMLSQFVVMFTVGDRLRSRTSVLAGLSLSVLTFLSFPLATNFWQLWLAQFPLAIAWAFLYVGGLRMLNDCNVEKATANGLFTSVIALSAIIGPVLSTIFIQFTDYRGIMYMAALMSLAGTLIFVAMSRRGHMDSDGCAGGVGHDNGGEKENSKDGSRTARRVEGGRHRQKSGSKRLAK